VREGVALKAQPKHAAAARRHERELRVSVRAVDDRGGARHVDLRADLGMRSTGRA